MHSLLEVPRPAATTLLLWLAFLSGCLFLGIGENLLLLWVSAGFLLAALAAAGPRSLQAVFAPGRYDGWLCLGALAVLAVSYFFVTFAPEGSFAVSWILGAVPLAYLACSTLTDRRLLRALVVATVSIFALISVARFLLEGQRAYEPLLDPNNYASLLYLIWIPLAHSLLLRAWEQRLEPLRGGSAALLLFVLALAVFATTSRAGAAVLAAALLGWLLLALVRGWSLKPWIALAALTALAYGVTLLLADGGAGAAGRQELGDGLEIRSALNGAAWDIYRTAPLTGSGVSTFPSLYPLYRRVEDQSTAGMFVHNDYLQLLAETGPWLLLLLAVVALATARKLLLALFRPDHGRDFGVAMAVAALLAHASLNFVFYILPLCLLMGGLLAELFGREPEPAPATAAAAPALASASWVGMLLLSLVAWVFLALDVAVQGVFGEQPAPAALRSLRGDPDAALRFARHAQRLNDRRATPLLGEVFLSAALLSNQQATPARLAAMRGRFRRALAADPLNPLVYEQYYAFLKQSANAELLASLEPEEAPDALLLRAVELDVRRVDTLFELLRVLDRLKRSEEAYALLKERVFPWLERLHWDNPASARRVLAELRRRAPADDRNVLLARLDEREEAISGAVLPPSGHWLRQHMRAWGQSIP